MKKLLKQIYYSSYALVKGISNQIFDVNPVVVFVYHRVNDQYQDPLTVGVDQFRRQMKLLKKRCDVVPLSELLERGSYNYRETSCCCYL